MSSFVDVVVIIATVLGVAAFVVGLFWAIANLGGWASLARKYPGQPPDADADRGLGSITLGYLCNYNNCIRWQADDDYLHLRVMTLFSLFHPPVSIPWIDVEIGEGRFGVVPLKVAGRRIAVPPKMLARELRNRDLLAARPPVKG